MDRAALLDELIDLLPPTEGRRVFTLEDFAGAHAPQLGLVRDRSQLIHVLCARQSGKTWGDDGVLLDQGFYAPRSTNLFLGLKGTGVRISNWFPIWKPLCDRYDVPADWHNETSMLTTFPNMARVMFAGTDDLSNIKKYLGNRLDNSVLVIDESQDQPVGVLRYLLDVLLPPMMTPTTRIILSGVLPDVPAGYFLDLARYDPESKTGGKGHGFSHHEWGRAANVHTPEAMEQLESYLRARGLSRDDPQVQRDWYMRRVWDAAATTYRYERTRAGYDGAAPAWLDSFTVGIDPGTRDRTAIQVWGWGPKDRNVYHVHEWVTARDANTTWAQIGAELKAINDRWHPFRWYYDAGGSQMTLDTFLRDYGIPVIKAANKNDLPGQVARMADLLAAGRARVRIGSALEEDLLRAQWDKDARAKGLYRWSSAWHPDAADAARYALQGYFDAYKAPRTPETAEQQENRSDAEMLRPPSSEEWMRDDMARLGLQGDRGGGYGPPD